MPDFPSIRKQIGAVWDELTEKHGKPNTFGKLIQEIKKQLRKVPKFGIR